MLRHEVPYAREHQLSVPKPVESEPAESDANGAAVFLRQDDLVRRQRYPERVEQDESPGGAVAVDREVRFAVALAIQACTRGEENRDGGDHATG